MPRSESTASVLTVSNACRIAVVQSRIDRDIRINGAHIRLLLSEAAAQAATLALFPEGALSGYAKTQVTDCSTFDWAALADEGAATADHAAKLGIIAVVGTAHALTNRRPHNSLQALSTPVRYDKRYLSHTEINGWYTPGFTPVVLAHSGFTFGLTLCIEMQFPELFAEYETLGVDAVLHATYGLGPIGDIILRAHAATNCLWLAVATPANADAPASGIIAPNGNWLARCDAGVSVTVATLDRADPELDIALNKARSWRRVARDGSIYRKPTQAATNFSDTPLMQ